MKTEKALIKNQRTDLTAVIWDTHFCYLLPTLFSVQLTHFAHIAYGKSKSILISEVLEKQLN